MTQKPTVGVALFTLNGSKHLQYCLPPLLKSPLKPTVLVVDSSSTDDTVAVAQHLGAQTAVISRKDFNHGLTREWARRHLRTDIVVMMTPDAYAVDEGMLGILIDPIMKGDASVAYARQIPHQGAGFFEAFPRQFNYPEKSQLRSIDDTKAYGVYTFFCSDSCAAYSNRALNEIGGFKQVLLGEDTVAVAELLRRGHKVAYVAEARVAHSHSYSLKQEFKRYFDTGLARSTYGDLLACEASDSQRGQQQVRALMRELWKKKPLLIPYALIQTACKWWGYRLGKWSTGAPIWWKQWLSAHPGYWTSSHYRSKVFKTK
ncbi:MAG: glycosyltransferase [Parachlamydiaceae bacterium]|nr:glycosyltransferase [Parachlamydiaceae bacterium]